MSETINLSTFIANNQKFKSKTIKVNKLSDVQNINITGALEGQVQLVKKGGKLVLNVYKQAGAVTYTYKEVITAYDGHHSPYTKVVYTWDCDINGNVINSSVKESKVSKKPTVSHKYYVYKNGKLYKTVKSSDEFANYKSSAGKSVSNTLLGSYTIVNAQDASEGVTINVTGANFIAGGQTYINKDILSLPWEVTSPLHSHTFTGSNLNEYSYSTSSNETFNLGGGTDTIYFTKGSTFGNDTVKLSNNSALTLDLGSMGFVSEVKKNSSDVILHLGDANDTNGKITLKGYLKKTTTSITVTSGLGTDDLNDILSQGRTLGEYGSATKQTLVGTILNEKFNCGNRNDVILTGGGQDTIDTAGGNATIKINGSGEKVINVLSSGTPTITRVNPNGTGTAYLKFNTSDLTYVKGKGSDSSCLVIKSGDKDMAVVKGFFGGSSFNKTYDSNASSSIGARIEAGSIKLLVDKKDSSAVTVKGSKYSDKIYGGKRTSYIYADEGSNEIFVHAERKGKTKMTAGKGNDTYRIQNDMSNAKNTYIIADKGGNNDSIVCSSPGMFAFFDIKIDKNGNFSSNETTLHFLDTNKVLSGGKIKQTVKEAEKITIQNAMKKSDTDATDKGWIETVNGTYKSSYTINSIRSDVASWLNTNHYSSVSQALSKADNTSLQELMQIYISKYSV